MSKGEDVGVGLLLVGVVATVAAILARIWVFAAYWRWFVTPTFGLPVPPFAACCGLAFMVALFRVAESHEPEGKEKPYSQRLVNSFEVSVIMYLLGALLASFGPLS